ncbi:MAG: DUF1223 domain-containing protein [Alphaproteobacteria bacterium]|nr:DUF1223 domain-containing protein [Alphaproteobacteria bacterium]
MMKTLSFILSLGVFALLSYGFIPAHADDVNIDVGKAPIVVELFTSQGCSSCPPAEKILGQLSGHQRIYTLSCHVTYWDYLGWEDTFGLKSCDQRQFSIMKARGKGNYYTPQMVVNGRDEFPGHRSNAIKSAIEKSAKAPLRPISLSHKDQSTIIAMLPPAPTGNYTLWAFGYEEPQTVNVQGGENRGRKLLSTNTVRVIQPVDTWDGSQKMVRFDVGRADELDGVVLIAQQEGYGPIIASGRLEF